MFIIKQTSASQTTTSQSGLTIPPPLAITPSRARRTLAARLAQRTQEKAVLENDPDAADNAVLSVASMLPDEPIDIDLGAATERDIEEATATRFSRQPATQGTGKFSGLFSSSEDEDDSDSSGHSSNFDEDDAVRDHTLFRPEGDYEDMSESSTARLKRRPITTEAKQRTPLDDEDEDEEDSSSDDEGMVEIRPRRTS